MKLESIAWPLVEAVAGRTVALLPLGATEQHGPHMAVSTDTCIVKHIAEQAEAARPDELALLPTFCFGASHHHLAFAGTMSLPAPLYTSTVIELVRSLLAGGFRRILLLNGHAGNITPVKQALSELSREFDGTLQTNIALASYWELAGEAFAGAAPMESPALRHACEYETSMMLHLAPERVDMQRAQRANLAPSSHYLPWDGRRPDRGVTVVKQTQFLTSNGGCGEPARATAEKGRHLLQCATEALIALVDDFKNWKPMQDLRDDKPRD